MADQRLIPSGIRDVSTLAFGELIDRLGQIPLDQLLVNLVDNVDASALPHLIEQFHVAGYEGSAVAQTDAQRRALISGAIDLHRHKGTAWAVKRALAATGQDVKLTEWFDQVPPGAPHTALADIEIFDRPVDWGYLVAAIEAAINEWMPVRAHITVRMIAGTKSVVHHGICCCAGDRATVYPHMISEADAGPGTMRVGIGQHSWMLTEVKPR